jgi:hypothetical protein
MALRELPVMPQGLFVGDSSSFVDPSGEEMVNRVVEQEMLGLMSALSKAGSGKKRASHEKRKSNTIAKFRQHTVQKVDSLKLKRASRIAELRNRVEMLKAQSKKVKKELAELAQQISNKFEQHKASQKLVEEAFNDTRNKIKAAYKAGGDKKAMADEYSKVFNVAQSKVVELEAFLAKTVKAAESNISMISVINQVQRTRASH